MDLNGTFQYILHSVIYRMPMVIKHGTGNFLTNKGLALTGLAALSLAESGN